MITSFTYTDERSVLPPVSKLVRAWANRRHYPISWEVNGKSVRVSLDAPCIAEHNRAVRSLSRILDRAILHACILNRVS